MFGWEFPPFSKGGLGTACYGLTKGLKHNNVDVTFVLPKTPVGALSDHVNLVGADNFYMEEDAEMGIKTYKIPSLLVQYITP